MAVYNNPAYGQAISNLAQLFAPPSAQELTAGAQIGLLNAKTTAEKQEASRLADLYSYASDPAFNKDVFDRRAVATGRGSIANGYYGVDTQAATSQANNAADNARALQQTQMQEQGQLARLYAAPIKLGQGETAILPDQTAAATGLAGTLQGQPKPLSETEWKAQQAERLRAGGQLTDADLVRGINGGIPTEEIVGPNGKPQIVYRPDAVGQQPAPKQPGVSVQVGPNGEPLGSPGEGLVWQRGPDGQVVMDERGAPIAIPFQGGKVYQQQQVQQQKQAATSASANQTADIVTQDIDRALPKVGFWTTGNIGAALEGVPIIGQGATDLSSLLDTIGANISFDKLQAMRAASPTGGALGAVSDRENMMLQSTLGSLRQSQSPEQLRQNLQRLRDLYRYVVYREGAPPPGLEDLSGAPAAAPAAPAAAAPASRGVGGPAPVQNQSGAPAFEQMDGPAISAWIKGNPDAVKSLSDQDYQRLLNRAQQLGAQ